MTDLEKHFVRAEQNSQVMTARVMEWDQSEDVYELPIYNGYRLERSLCQRAELKLSFSDRWLLHRFENAGRTFIVPPSQKLLISAQPGTVITLICHIEPSVCGIDLDTNLEWTDNRLRAGIDVCARDIEHILEVLAKELRSPGFASSALIESLGVQLAVRLHRFYSEVQNSPVSGGLAPWRLRLVDDALRESRNPPSLFELARLCGMSVRHLSRAFKVSRGISVSHHIAELRLGQAKAMLNRGDSVKSVAFATGFKSSSSFCNAFRDATGLRPTQFRAEFRG